MSLAQWLFLAFPLPFVGVGGWLCWLGVKTLSGAAGGVRARAHAAVSEPVSPGAVDEGPAIVTGEVEATGATLTAPFSGDDAVAYRYGIRQQTPDVGWWDVAEGTVSNAFTVQGPTGRVLVDPGEEPIDTGLEPVGELSAEESLPENVRSRVRASDAFDLERRPGYLAAAVTEPRRYAEGTLDPGAEVHVYGTVSQAETGEKRIAATDSGVFAAATEPLSDIDDPPGSEETKTVVVGVFVLLMGLVFGGVGVAMVVGGLQGVLGVAVPAGPEVVG